MTRAPRPLVAGNWKMNGLQASGDEFRKILAAAADVKHADLLICPPATLISIFGDLARESPVRVGGQDCHAEASGAFTGDLSAEMLADAGATFVIVGHSERRAYHKEGDADVKAKAMAAARAKLTAIVCVGETKEERDAGATLARIERQLSGSLPDDCDPRSLVVAYEPVWAIGTGLTPTVSDIAQVHDFIRERLTQRSEAEGEKIRILYGGSVKPSNAAEILTTRNVDGALVGGASLKAADFVAIAAAYRG